MPVSRAGESMAMSMMICGSSAGAKATKDTTTSPVLPLSAVPVLPPDAVALHLSVAAAAIGDHILQALTGHGGGLLADYLTQGGVVVLIHHSAAAVPDLFHHMGLVQVAAVDAGGLCGDEGRWGSR